MTADKKKPIISMIVAMSQNGVIGAKGAMPWRLPNDLRYFKQATLGKPIIMGGNTWFSLTKKPLPGRANIILSRQEDFKAEGALIANSIDQAIKIAIEIAQHDGEKEIFIIGGGEVFKQSLPLIDRIYLTEILANLEGDTFLELPKNLDKWCKLKVETPTKQEQDSHSYRFVVYEKNSG